MMSEAQAHLVHVIANRIMGDITASDQVDENSWNLARHHATLALEAVREHLNLSAEELLELSAK